MGCCHRNSPFLRKRDFIMTQYGLQMFSLRDITKDDLKGALAAMAKLGYKKVEFAGFFGHDAKDVKAWLDEYGLVASGTHTAIEEIAPDKIEETIAYHKAIGCNVLIIPAYHNQDEEASLEATISAMNYAEPILKEAGIRLAFHNHSGEFQVKPFGKRIFDELYNRTNIFFELDTFWAWAAGENPVELMKQLHSAGRLCEIHLKDGHQSVNGARPVGKSLGSGDAPVKAVRECALELGVTMVVESETLTPTGIEEVGRCMDFLKSLE